MRKIFRKHEELSFTIAVYGLLVLVLGGFLAVRLSKEGHAKRRAGPRILSLEPGALVLGASERVSVMSDRTHFGPRTTVESSLPGVYFTNIRFVSEREMTFEAHVLEWADLEEAAEIPFVIRSPVEGEEDERIALELSLTQSAEPLELDLSNFGGRSRVEVEGDHVMFGYRPKGHGPFRFSARSFDTGKVFEQETRSEIDHLGVPLEPGENTFELVLEDALGREVRKVVTVQRKVEVLPPGVLANAARVLWTTYTGKPVQWSSDPTEQVGASDCVLGNGPLGCASGGCGARSSRPPPNDYVTSLGQVEIGGEGVLLHNGEYREDVVDLYIPGRGLDFVFKRSYQSGLSLDGYLGKNWDFNWAAQFILTGTLPCDGKFSRGDGRRDTYSGCQLQGSEYVFTTLPTGYIDLKTSVVSSASEIRQTKRNGFWQTFDQTTGKLKTRQDRYGNNLTVSYDFSGKLSAVTDTLGRNIYFSYGISGAEAGRLIQIADFAVRLVNYEYKELWTNGPVVLTKVRYPATDWIDDTTDPWTTKTNVSRTTSYEYEATNAARLTRGLDGRGKERVKNVYDANGRVDYQYNYSSGSYHNFTWTLVSGKVNQALWESRAGNDRKVYFDTTKHLSTKVEVIYAETATTEITRDCACTLPTAIKEPDNGYNTFTIDSNGNVTEKRQYFDNDPVGGYTTTAGSDLVRKAYFAPVAASQFGVCTKVVGPKAFTATPNEAAYSTTITYDYSGNPITISYPDTTNPSHTGHTEVRTYNSSGQLHTVSRAIDGSTSTLITYTYYDGVEAPTSNKGYLKELIVKYAAAADQTLTTRYEYTSFGARTKVTDPLLRNTTYLVDNEFLVKKVTTPGGSLGYDTEFAYNGNRVLVQKKLQNKRGTTLQSNEWLEERLIFGTGGELLTKREELTESGGTITWEDVTFAYDPDFQLTLITDALGKKTLFYLDGRALRTKVIRAYATPTPSPDESEETYVFDKEAKVTKVVRPFKNDGDMSNTEVVTRIAYDAFDRKEYVYDGDADATPDNYQRFYYDLASVVTEVEEYNSAGNLLRQGKNYYDELNRLWKATRGTGEEDTTTFEYDLASRRTKTKDDNDSVNTTEYDLASRVTKTLTPNLAGAGQNSKVLVYDANGNVTTVTSREVLSDGSGYSDYVWEMLYDDLNRRTKTTFKGNTPGTGPDPDDISVYDSRGNIATYEDVDNLSTEYQYDGRGRLTLTTIHPGSQPEVTLNRSYDAAGNLATRTDDEDPANVTSYAHDDQNRVTKETLEDGDWIEWKYNDLGLVMTKRWGNSGSAVKTIKYRYDARGLLRTKQVSWTTTPSWSGYDDYLGAEEYFTYDGVNRLTDADDEDTRVTLAWNSLDQLTSETLEVSLLSGVTPNWKMPKTTSSEWDATGRRRTKLTYPISTKAFEYAHDALDRVTQIAIDRHPSTDYPMVKYFYEGPGLDVTKRERGWNLGSSAKFDTEYSDDDLKRVTKIHHKRDSADLRIFDYTWGDGSSGKYFQRSSYKISSDASTMLENSNFGYDVLGRLSTDTWTHPEPDEEYKYTVTTSQFLSKLEKTPAGGSTTTEREFTKATDGSLQLTDYTNPTTSFSYDACGNMTARTSAGQTTYYYYDHENRLAHIDSPTGADFWFRYDVLGRRVVEKEYSTERLFYYDGLHIVEETDSSLNLTRLALFGIQLDELLYSGNVSGGNLTDHHWPLTDHLGSVIQVVNDSGTMLTNFDYTRAYGEATVTGTESSYPYGFTGRRRILGALPLYDYRTRVYDPGCGRFLQRDSIGTWGDPINLGNGYAYVGNDSINTVDPLGAEASGEVVSSSGSIVLHRSRFVNSSTLDLDLLEANFLNNRNVILAFSDTVPARKKWDLWDRVQQGLGYLLCDRSCNDVTCSQLGGHCEWVDSTATPVCHCKPTWKTALIVGAILIIPFMPWRTILIIIRSRLLVPLPAIA